MSDIEHVNLREYVNHRLASHHRSQLKDVEGEDIRLKLIDQTEAIVNMMDDEFFFPHLSLIDGESILSWRVKGHQITISIEDDQVTILITEFSIMPSESAKTYDLSGYPSEEVNEALGKLTASQNAINPSWRDLFANFYTRLPTGKKI